jgi:hypothetical protein
MEMVIDLLENGKVRECSPRTLYEVTMHLHGTYLYKHVKEGVPLPTDHLPINGVITVADTHVLRWGDMHITILFDESSMVISSGRSTRIRVTRKARIDVKRSIAEESEEAEEANSDSE